MANNTLGGFFVELGVNTKKGDFEVATKSIIGIGNSVLGLLGTVKNAVPLIAEQLGALGKTEDAGLKMAYSLGMSTSELDRWKIAAKTANVNAEGLITSMSNLDQKLTAMTFGARDEGLAKALGFLGLNDMDFKDLDPTERMIKIFNAVDKSNYSQKEKLKLVSDILGGEAANMYSFIQMNDKYGNLGDLLNRAGSLVFTDDDTALKASNFTSELNQTMEAFKQLKALFGAELADKFTPILENLNNWLAEHGDELIKRIQDIAGGLGDFITSLTKMIPDLGKQMTDVFDLAWAYISGDEKTAKAKGEEIKKWQDTASKKASEVAGAANKIIHGEDDPKSQPDYQDKKNNQRNAIQKQIIAEWLAKNPGKKESDFYSLFNSKMDLTSLSTQLQRQINDYFNTYDPEKNDKSYFRIKDGIVRPNGQVTQVDPNDWVFAAKDVGALASAFIPRSLKGTNQEASGNYVINQTFNVTGSGDIGESVRQQAYRGTQQGLVDSLRERQVRLQMMPGLA